MHSSTSDRVLAHGWAITTATSAEDLMAASNRAVPAGLDDAVPKSVFVEAISEAS
jgi:hypothetical protein